MSVRYVCCVLSGTGLCDGSISRPQESYRLGVSECDREVSIIQKPWPTRGCRARAGKELTENYGKKCVTERQSLTAFKKFSV